MKGKILNFDESYNIGIIVGSDGKRYNFNKEEWKEDKAPKKNQTVDFEINEENATAIYLDSESIVDLDGVKEKLSDIGLDRENIDSTIASAKVGIDKAGNVLGPWIESLKARTRQVLIYGAAYKRAFMLSMIIFFIFYMQLSINSIFNSGILNIFTYIMLALSLTISIRLAYVKEMKITSKAITGLFVVIVIFVGLGIVFWKPILAGAGMSGFASFLQSGSTYSYNYGGSILTNTLGGGSSVMGGYAFAMMSMFGAGVMLFLNIILFPAIVLILLAGVKFFFKEKNINDYTDTNTKMTKKHTRWVGIFVAVLTLVLGFIGTFISRYMLGEQSLKETFIPTALHFALGFVLIIPSIGFLLFFAGTIYIAYLNIMVVLHMIRKNKGVETKNIQQTKGNE